MRDAFSAMEYPHWPIVTGAMVLGFIGFGCQKQER
jgi:hypothetical protein